MPDDSAPPHGASPMVSIVIAVRNGTDAIADCVESLLALEYPPDRREIIVVDNGSTDGTPDVLRRFAGRIEVLTAPRRGAAAARNAGIRAARGTIVAFTDADATVAPGWLTALVPALGNRRVGIAGGPILSRRPCNRIERFGEEIHDHRVAIEDRDLPYAVTGNWASHRDVLLEVGLFDETLLRGQDVDLAWRIRQAGYELLYVADAVVYHRNERTIWGLWHEGFTHGRAAVQVRGKHAALIESHGGNGSHAFRRVLRDMRRVAGAKDPANDLLKLIFDAGKAGGELAAHLSARARRGSGAARP